MTPRRPLTAEQWNARYPVGVAVSYHPISGFSGHSLHKTASKARTVDRDVAVVRLDGWRRYTSLIHIRPIGRRLQRRRTRGWRMPPGAVYVGRPTLWGNIFVPGRENPFIPGRLVEDERHAWRLYQAHARVNAALVAAAQQELGGCDLVCWCGLCPRHADGLLLGVSCPDCVPCHADVLLALANPHLLRAPAPSETVP